ncbi:hypothetical protein SAY87_017816 [Trapa incisa]|uniref:Uncharacterized protein n=1 Tax=Trapa incisa TaxID=236973 RepID=A0AAN7L506_9MYRT|nr:hypothetical protein SAY87_017816 [Trapa incisa]
MVQSLELLLVQFLMPDNDGRRQAEELIKRLANDPQVVPSLIQHLRTGYPSFAFLLFLLASRVLSCLFKSIMKTLTRDGMSGQGGLFLVSTYGRGM